MVSQIPHILREKFFFPDDIRFGKEMKLRANMFPVCVAVLLMSAIVIVTRVMSGKFIIELLWAMWMAFFLEMAMIAQLAARKYSFLTTSLLGGFVFAASVFLLFEAQMAGLSPVCFLLFPHVGLVAKHPKYTIFCGGVLFFVAVVLLRTPAYNLLQATYSEGFRSQYPWLLLGALSVVCYVEVLRHKMQKRLSKMEEELHTMAFRDELTKSYNRHALISHFGSLVSDAGGYSFALLDLDDFKRINDTYGHFVGDDVLRHVTHVIQRQIPEDGCLYRWGGEEFLIAVRETPRAEFVQLLERIRAAIYETPLFRNGTPISVTSSFGAVFKTRGVSVQSCLMQADKQLYDAKRNGKNRVSYQEAS